MTIDFRRATFEELHRFVFDHPLPGNGEQAWHGDEEWDEVLRTAPVDAERQLRLLTELFRSGRLLATLYSDAQLNQGFWFLFSEERLFQDPLWDRSVPWEVRTAFLDATVDLYEQLLSVADLPTVAEMFWDQYLCHRYGYPTPTRFVEEDALIRAYVFQTLRRLLNGDDSSCQGAALHGLYHLDHPGTAEVIEKFLDRADVSAGIRQYALRVLAGEAL